MAALTGDSSANNQAGVTGNNNTPAGGNGIGVLGASTHGEGVHGQTSSATSAAVAGFSTGGYEGVHGETTSNAAAVGAINRGTSGPAFFGISQGGEGVHGETKAPNHAAVAGFNNATATGPGAWGVWGSSQTGEGVHGETNSPTFAAVAGVTLNAAGTGAGIYGESRGQGPAGFFRGNVVVTGDVQLTGADCAEQFDVIAASACEPGTVMVLGDDGAVEPSSRQYDKRVAGVISGAAKFKPGVVLDSRGPQLNRKPIALIGKVYCKADATYGAIAVGDLLTTSATPGHAMKAEDPLRAFGAVLGKALGALQNGTGLIPVLVALQ